MDVRSDQLGIVRLVILLALAAAATYALGLLLWPFLPAIVTSATFAVLVFPLHRWLRGHTPHPILAALISTVGVFVLVLIPIVGLSFVLVDQVGTGLERVAGWIADAGQPGGRITGWIEGVALHVGLDDFDVAGTVRDNIETIAGAIAGRTLGVITGIGGTLLQAAAALFTLYYLLRDAESVLGAAKRFIPLAPLQVDALLRRAHEVILATVYGNVVVAIVQGTLGGIAFALVGLPSAVLWGTVMGVLSLLPAVGPPIVWLPAALSLLAGGRVAQGVILLIVGTGIISTIDNVLRAVLVSDRAQLHPLVAFFSVLGGLFVFGAVGIFVGPVLFVLAATVIEMAHIPLEEPESIE